MNQRYWTIPFVIVLVIVISACSPAKPDATTVAMTALFEKEVEVQATPAPTQAPAPQTSGGHALPADYQRSNRLIIKNAELDLLVSDTDSAMDLVTQIVSDVDGYIVSSRVWYETWQDESYKYASLTLGVPVVHFETAMRRLRGTAVQVIDESAAGQDVTDEYVDLESRLVNLRATRDRIREFLDQAKDVEQALKVNSELAAVESDIETVQGRMNYLFDRAAYSTISVQLSPAHPPAPTPTPTPLPQPWSVTKVTTSASRTLVSALQTLVEIFLWLGIVVGPFVLPPAVIALLIWRMQRRKAQS